MKEKNVRKWFVAALIAGGLLAGPAQAQEAWDDATISGAGFSNGNHDFGDSFTVNTTVTVIGLGFFDGSLGASPVALYLCADPACSTTGTLLASATVTGADSTDVGHFAYDESITPVTLTAGDAYEVAGSNVSSKYFLEGTSSNVSINPDISMITYGGQPALLGTSTTAAFMPSGGFIYSFGPNLLFGTPATVPEPMTLSMFAVGLTGLWMIRRKKVA